MNDARKPPLGDDPDVFDPDDEFFTEPPEESKRASLQFTNFLQRYSKTFIVIVLVDLIVVFHWVPDEVKIAFLHFFYLPVLAAGYLKGARRAVQSSVLCALLVLIYYLWVWAIEANATGKPWSARDLASANLETLLQLAIWAGFLTIVGGAFGRVNEHVMASYTYVQKLRREIKHLKEKDKTEE